ncbi:phosphotransferase family protein [Thermomonospora amylolytica]|uniref:phosphotransferase family protein n=1 Tax=Thermomonospora amylolytica TaxID=1411117 RepID=UPI000E6BBD63|nr:aminoglycoside phosphotransferase family protein [Thermomonospora amylolytica]
MRKLQWHDLPDAARTAVEERFGPVFKAESAEHGIMPGLAARLYIEDGGSVFLKAVPNDSHAARLHIRERAANAAMTGVVPAPRMLWSADAGGCLLMVFQYVEGGRRADLSPASPDLPGVLEALSRIGGPGGTLPPVAANLEMLQEKAAVLLGKKLDGPQWGMYADALDALTVSALEGDALLHYDLHAGNLLVTDDATYVIDWSFACRGAAWIDAAMLVPRLIEAGHTPEQAEALMATLPAWKTAPADALTGLAALWTMFREYKARYGPQEARAFRARAAQAGRAWVTYRTR